MAGRPLPTWLVTGGAGFIGANFVLAVRAQRLARIVTLDRLRYPAVPESLAPLDTDPGHELIEGDVGDGARVMALLRLFRPSAIVHFAAESHVDRSIAEPLAFVETNVLGTAQLLEAARMYWQALDGEARARFRLLLVSTDEVFGTLAEDDPPFSEASPYRPRSPYAASKAGADHLAQAYGSTYGLPVVITHCTNNYGPRQHPEKLVPLAILRALRGRQIPVYGDGAQRRDWLFVDDHVAGLLAALDAAEPGERYLFGSGADVSNLALLEALCRVLDRQRPEGAPHAGLIRHVADRPGHDRRYAADPARARQRLGWRPQTPLAEGLARTVAWYLDNPGWLAAAERAPGATWVEALHRARMRA